MTARILLAFGVLILVVGTIYAVVRPRISQWGASDQEHLSTWPGDEFAAEPNFKMMLGIKQPAERNSSSVAGIAAGPPRHRPPPEQRDLVMNGSSKQSREAD